MNWIIPEHVPPERILDFDLNHQAGLIEDFFTAWTDVQDKVVTDLVWTPRNGGHWMLTRAAHTRTVLEDTKTFSSRSISVPPDITSATEFIPLQLDPPEHDDFRRVIQKEFAPSYVASLQPDVRAITLSLIDQLGPAGGCEFISDFAEILPVHVFLSLVGLPVEDRLMLRDLVVHLNNPTPDMDGAELVRRIDDYLAPHVRARLDSPGADLFSRILSKPVANRSWTFGEAMRMCRNLLFGGLDTVVSMLSFVTLHLAKTPADQERLRVDPALIPAAANEFIRRFGTVSLCRVVTRDTELDGVTVRAGDMIAVPLMLHNLDPEWIADARSVKLDRGPTRHMSMGSGVHRCVGEGLARMELILFLEEWLSRVPAFELAGEVSMRGGGVGAMERLPLRWNWAERSARSSAPPGTSMA